MAGTDHARSRVGPGPAVILVEPQLGENIGGCARAMLNCGLVDLRLVKPRDGWPNPAAEAMAVGATDVLKKARVYNSTADACADLTYVLATTARSRGIAKQALVPRSAAAQLRARVNAEQAVGVMFGPERAGLMNEDITLADAVITVPLNPGFASLNLAQAVLLIGYEWFQSGSDALDVELMTDSPPAPVEKREFLFSQLEAELEEVDHFFPDHLGPTMRRNLRALFIRAGLTVAEVQSLHGVIKALSGKRRSRRRRP